MSGVPRSPWLIVEPAILSVGALLLTLACLRFALRTKSRSAWLMTLSSFAIFIMGAWSAVNLSLHLRAAGIGHYIMAHFPFWCLETAQFGIGTGLFFFVLGMRSPSGELENPNRFETFVIGSTPLLLPLGYLWAMWLDEFLIWLLLGELALFIGAILLFRRIRNSGTFLVLLSALSGLTLLLIWDLTIIMFHFPIMTRVFSPNSLMGFSFIILSFGLFLFAPQADSSRRA